MTARWSVWLFLVLGCEQASNGSTDDVQERVRPAAVLGAPSAFAPVNPERALPAQLVGATAKLFTGQELYLPVYSSTFGLIESKPFALTVTVSIRNTARLPLVIENLEYIGSRGETLEHVVEKAYVLGPLETREYVIRRKDNRGGAGANFMLAWHADVPVTAPLLQAVNVYLERNRAFGFVTDAVVVKEKR